MHSPWPEVGSEPWLAVSTVILELAAIVQNMS
jgi:hypothetical protein